MSDGRDARASSGGSAGERWAQEGGGLFQDGVGGGSVGGEGGEEPAPLGGGDLVEAGGEGLDGGGVGIGLAEEDDAGVAVDRSTTWT